MSRWWRAYDEAVDDPKLQRLGPALGWAWFNLMCITSKNGGVLPPIGDVAFKLRTTDQRAAATITALVSAGLFERNGNGQFAPHNWSGRQFQSDVSTERVQRFRKRERNVSPTVSETPPDTEAETETKQKDSEPDGSAAGAAGEEPADEEPKAKLFRIGKTTLVSFGVAEKRTGSLIGQWLKTRNDPQGLLAAIEYAREQNVADPVAYISALLSKAKPNGNHGKQDLSAMCFAIADELRHQELAGSPSRSDELFRGS